MRPRTFPQRTSAIGISAALLFSAPLIGAWSIEQWPTGASYGVFAQVEYESNWLPSLDYAWVNGGSFVTQMTNESFSSDELFDWQLWDAAGLWENGNIRSPGANEGGPQNGANVLFTYTYTAINSTDVLFAMENSYTYVSANSMMEQLDNWSSFGSDTLRDDGQICQRWCLILSSGLYYFNGAYDTMSDGYPQQDYIGNQLGYQLAGFEDFPHAWIDALSYGEYDNHPSSIHTSSVSGDDCWLFYNSGNILSTPMAPDKVPPSDYDTMSFWVCWSA